MGATSGDVHNQQGHQAAPTGSGAGADVDGKTGSAGQDDLGKQSDSIMGTTDEKPVKDTKERDPDEEGVFSSKYASAGEREPESAETVAAGAGKESGVSKTQDQREGDIRTQ